VSYELWTILNNWRDEFTSEEFARTFASPNPRKALYDMTAKGLLVHIGYGRYRVRTVSDYAKSRNDVTEGYELLKKSNLSYALTGVDGVFVWTGGGYNAGRFFGSYPIHIKVYKLDMARWRRFLAGNGKKTMQSGRAPKETMFGVYYTLYPQTKIKADIVDGLRVEPLKDAVEFCKKNIYTFEPALEMLDGKYGLKIRARYSR
jgi:hypothetical protein